MLKLVTGEEGKTRLRQAIKEIEEKTLKERKEIEDNFYVYKAKVEVEGKEKEVIEILQFSLDGAKELVEKAKIDLAKARYGMDNLERLKGLSLKDIQNIIDSKDGGQSLTYSESLTKLIPFTLPEDKQIEKEAFTDSGYWKPNMDKHGRTYWLEANLYSGKQRLIVNSLDGDKLLTREYELESDDVITTYWTPNRGKGKDVFDEKEYGIMGETPLYAVNSKGEKVKTFTNAVKFRSELIAVDGSRLNLSVPSEIATTTQYEGCLDNLKVKTVRNGDSILLRDYSYFPNSPYAIVKIPEMKDGFYTGKTVARVVEIDEQGIEKDKLDLEDGRFIAYRGLNAVIEREDKHHKAIVLTIGADYQLHFTIYPVVYQEEITPTNQIKEKLTGYKENGAFTAINKEENIYAGPLKIDAQNTNKYAKNENGEWEKDPFETSSLKESPDFVKGERAFKITNKKQNLTWDITKNVRGHQIKKTDFYKGGASRSLTTGTFDYSTLNAVLGIANYELTTTPDEKILLSIGIPRIDGEKYLINSAA